MANTQQQSEYVIVTDYAEFDVERLEFAPPRRFNSMQIIGVTVNGGKKLLVKTPTGMHCPFGLNSYNNGEKLSVNVSLRGHQEDPAKAAFMDFLNRFDDRVRRAAEADPSWFGGSPKSAEVLNETYTPLLKGDPQGRYAPTVRLNFVTSGGNTDTALYGDVTSEKLPIESATIPKGCTCTALFFLTNVWVMGNKLGVSPKIQQVRRFLAAPPEGTDSPGAPFRSDPLAAGCAFVDSDDEE